MVSRWPLRLGFALAFILLGVLAVLSVWGLWKYWGKLNSDTWIFGRDCLLMLQVVGVIALLNTGFVYLLVSHLWTLMEVFWKIGLGTFIISIIPVALMLIYDRYQLQKSQLKASLVKQTDLVNQVAQQAVSVEQICFTTEQGKPVCVIILFSESKT